MVGQSKLAYVPRDDALGRVLDLLGSGKHVALFSPPGQGKTAFLRYELMPAALKAGWFAAHIGLATAIADPVLGLIRGLECAALWSGDPVSRQVERSVRMEFSRLRWGCPVVEIAGGPTQCYMPTQATAGSEAERLASAMDVLGGTAKRAVIMIDAFGTIGASEDKHNCMAVLRARMEQLRGNLSLLFVEPSRTNLIELFRSAQAPLFGLAEIVKLAPLAEPFLRSRLAFAEVHGVTEVDLPRLAEVFERLKHVPSFLDQVIIDAAQRGESTIDVATARWELGAIGTHMPAINKLNALERALLIWLAFPGTRPIYSVAARRALAWIQGAQEQPSVTRTQSAVKRLLGLGYIEWSGVVGRYHIRAPDLAVALGAMAGDVASIQAGEVEEL